MGPRCSRVKPTPPASHQLILDRDRTGRGEKREGDKIYYKCEDPSHSINGTQETVTTSLECDAEGDYSPKDADGRPAFPVCMPRDTIQHKRNIFGLSFGLNNGLRFGFDSATHLNYPFSNV